MAVFFCQKSGWGISPVGLWEIAHRGKPGAAAQSPILQLAISHLSALQQLTRKSLGPFDRPAARSGACTARIGG